MTEWTQEAVEIKLCEAMQLNLDLATIDAWLDWLSPIEKNIVSMRSKGLPWKTIAHRQCMDQTSAWRKYKRAIGKLCRRLQAIDDDIAIVF